MSEPQKMLSPQDRADGRRLEQAATKAPWEVLTEHCDCGGEFGCSHGEYPYALHGPKNVAAETVGPDYRARYGHQVSEISEMTEADVAFVVWLRNHASALLAADEDRDRWMASAAGYGSDAVEWKIRAEAAEAALARERQAHATTQAERDNWKKAAVEAFPDPDAEPEVTWTPEQRAELRRDFDEFVARKAERKRKADDYDRLAAELATTRDENTRLAREWTERAANIRASAEFADANFFTSHEELAGVYERCAAALASPASPEQEPQPPTPTQEGRNDEA